MHERTKPTLLVLAAGIGSRFGGVKQTAGVGPCGEAILDYSVYDAIRAGFGKAVFVINSRIERTFCERLLPRIAEMLEVEYTLQDRVPLVDGLDPSRARPWGTAHAVLAAADRIAGPFAVINADDFYGRESFYAACTALGQDDSHCLVAYRLGETLSPNGPVSRGVCDVDGNRLERIVEHENLEMQDGMITSAGEAAGTLDAATPVSMNFWGFTAGIFSSLLPLMSEFAEKYSGESDQEFLLPEAINMLVRDAGIEVEVIPAGRGWFGITYPADLDAVRRNIRRLVDRGDYPQPLWRN